MDPGRAIGWEPPEGWQKVVVIDSHAGGEPFRVVVSGLGDIPGETMLAKRRHAIEHLDGLRRALMWEPRGHADMYGGWIGPPTSPGSDMSVLFTHNEGFSTMCGHGVIALTKVVFDTGMVTPVGERPTLVVDTPAGTVTAEAVVRDGRVEHVSFRNVGSFVSHPAGTVDVPGLGEVPYRLSFGGAFYAYVDRERIGLETAGAEILIAAGRAIKQAVIADAGPITHPDDPDLGFLYGVIFTGPPRDESNHSSHVCVFANGELDRSPTGTGVSGRLAILYADGKLGPSETIRVESIVGSVFTGRVVDVTRVGPYPAVIPEIGGSAHITGRAELWIDPADMVGSGFLLR
ncbi:MAG: proline racemase family protein [Actinobacteria bacterium]|nr:proline racemase family protein [Actinomycetota bacterium]